MSSSRPIWTEPDRATDAAPPPVVLWRLRLGTLGDAPLDTLQSLTVPDEHARAKRFRFDADRQRHLAGRGLVRLFAARHYGCSLQALNICEGPHGKPQFETTPGEGPSLEFNVAHAEDVVVAAFSRDQAVGIDVEPVDRDADLAALSRRILTDAERQHWQALDEAERSHFFFQVWTCKEAFLKATGRGLRRAPSTVECVLDGDTIVGLRDAPGVSPSSPDEPADCWAVCSVPVSDRVLGAVVRHHRLPTPLATVDAGRLILESAHP